MEAWQRTLLVSWIAQVLALVGFSFVYPFLPLYVQHLGVHDQQSVLIWSGALFAGTTIAMTICAPIWGVLSDRYGRKMMIVRSMLSGAVLIFLMTLVRNPAELLVLRILQGMFTGSVAATQALVSAAVPRERLGFSMGLMQMAVFSGSSIGPLIGGQLDDHLGFQPTFLIAAAMLVAAGLMVILMIHEDFTPPPPALNGNRRGFWADAGEILQDRQIALLILVLAAIQFGGQIVGPILTIFVQDLGSSSGGAAAQAGNVFAIAGIGSAVTAVLAGRFTDRRGNFKLVLLVATIATTLITIPQYFVSSVEQLYVLRGITGLTIGGMLASSSAMLSLGTPPARRGAVIGLSAGANAAGQAAGQLSGSGIASIFGVRAVFLCTVVVLGAVSVLVHLGIREPAVPSPDDIPPTVSPLGTVATPDPEPSQRDRLQ